MEHTDRARLTAAPAPAGRGPRTSVPWNQSGEYIAAVWIRLAAESITAVVFDSCSSPKSRSRPHPPSPHRRGRDHLYGAACANSQPHRVGQRQRRAVAVPSSEIPMQQARLNPFFDRSQRRIRSRADRRRRISAPRNRVLAGLLRAPGRACAAGVLGSMCTNVHACVPPFIGHLLDTKPGDQPKLLILLARPRGLEPLFPP
jgi:hypothetical protein